MKTTGITRRIDELGRVVIPKEIRKNMHIKTGELLEIYLSDSETISLKKHAVMNQNQEFINTFVKALSHKVNSNIFITNMDDVIFSNVSEVINDKISSELEDYSTGKSSKDYINLTKKYQITKPYNIFPISPNGDLVGYMVFEFLDNNYESKKRIT